MPHILIVGGGLAGLAAAVSLRAAGHKVQVFDASRLTSEDTEGAVAQIGPKVNDVLRKWGLDKAVAQPVLIEEVSEFDQDGELKSAADGSQLPGWKYYQRSKLHAGLLKAATASNGPGIPVEVFLERKVLSVDATAGTLSTEAGHTYNGDIIVGADGWNSTAREAIPQPDCTIASPLKATVHLSIDISQCEGNPVVQRFHSQKNRYEKWIGANLELKLYSVEPGRLLIDTLVSVETEDELSTSSVKKKLLAELGSAHSDIKELIGLITDKEILFWFHPSLPGIDEWAKDRLVLIGDAAHPFLPFEAPGSSQSITGADALAAELGSELRIDKIPEHLAAWVGPRKARVRTIQALERKDWPSA